MKKQLYTKRLKLRVPKIEDCNKIFELYATDLDISKLLAWKPHKTLKETEKFIKSRINEWETETRFSWCIEFSETEELIGMITTKPQGEFAFSISYLIAKPFWGKGFATEAAKLVLDHLLSIDKVFRVEAFCDTENIGSDKVIRKIGMQYEGIARKKGYVPNISKIPRDCYMYSIVK